MKKIILISLCLFSMSVHAQSQLSLPNRGSSELLSDQPFLSQEELAEAEKLKQMRMQNELERQKRLQQRLRDPQSQEFNRTPQSSPVQSVPVPQPKEKLNGRVSRQPAELPSDLMAPPRSFPKSAPELSDEMPMDPLEQMARTSLRPPISTIESIFMGNFPDEVSREIQQFGYDLFSKAPNDFSAVEDVPVNPDYIVGPGDTFTINVWGSANFSHTVTVRRDGNIFIPKIGTLKVWGDSFKQMSSKIEKRLSSFFSGIKVNIAFESIRNIDVFVVGEVQKPGSYSVPSTSAVINVLFHSGGPTRSGSLRNIQLVRNNQTIATIDLYDFLIHGKNSIQKLQSQDVILVPVIGEVAAVAGHVKRPAIYEIVEGNTLFDVLQMAGGLSFTGEAGRLELQRVKGNKERVTRDFTIPEDIRTLNAKEAAQTELKAKVEDGDLVKIFPVLQTIRKTIFLSGHVKRPGSYEFKEGMKLRDLIKDFDALRPEPYTEYAQIVRIQPPKDERQAIFVNLAAALNGDESENISLQERDQVIIYSRDELNLREKVEIAGRVNRPGTYFFFDGMTLRDLILMAGNVTQDAYLGNVEVARYSPEINKLDIKRLQQNLGEVLKGNAVANIKLQPKDRVFVQGIANWEMQNTVEILGEVQFPGKYTYLPGEHLSSVIERAGGFTKKAFLKGAVFNRVSVREIQARALKQQIAQLEEAVLQEQVNPGEGSRPQDLKDLQEAAIARRTMLRNLQEAEVTGRMVIKLEKLKDFKNTSYDITLEPNDRLTIPATPSSVTVMGEVYNPTSMVFVDGKDIQHYLGMAGGPTVNADVDSIFVVKADGSVISRQQNRGFLLRNFYQTEVERGDTILVPKDISRFSWLQTTKDITDILFKIASTTGITIQAFK